MRMPITQKKVGNIGMDGAAIKQAEIEELHLPNGSGAMTKVTATADDINSLNLTSRKFTVYSAGVLAKGDLLHITGYNAINDVFSVEKADADTSGKPAQLVASEVNAGSATSLASDIEELTGLNTNAGNVGDPVYLSAVTAGSWTLIGADRSRSTQADCRKDQGQSRDSRQDHVQHRQSRDRGDRLLGHPAIVCSENQARGRL